MGIMKKYWRRFICRHFRHGHRPVLEWDDKFKTHFYVRRVLFRCENCDVEWFYDRWGFYPYSGSLTEFFGKHYPSYGNEYIKIKEESYHGHQ